MKHLYKIFLFSLLFLFTFNPDSFAQCELPEFTSISNDGPACEGGSVTLSASGTIGGVSSSYIRMAGIGGNFGNREFNHVFESGDRPGEVTRMTVGEFNALAAGGASALRASYDVLLFTWNSSTSLNAPWSLIEAYLALGGSVFWEDEKNIGDLSPGIVGTEYNGSYGCGYVLVNPPPFPSLVANGVNGCFINHHLRVTSWPSWMEVYILGGGGENLAIAGVHPTGGGRLIVQGPDMDFHADEGGSPESAPGNQYLMLLNQIDFLAAQQAGISWTGPEGFTSDEANPVITGITPAMAGVYTATLTNITGGGCSVTATTTVVVNGLPTISCPGPVSVNAADDQCGANVSFSATATDNTAPISYSPNPGSFFPVGTTTVTASTSNDCGPASCTLSVTVVDAENPEISCPGNISIPATSPSGAVATYTGPVGTDNCSATTSQTAGLSSGSVFPIGTTTNSFTVTDPAGLSASCSFSVTVTPVAPDIMCPGNITVSNDDGDCSAEVTFAATETTGIPASSISYSHSPGSAFAVGTTTVTATATNVAGSDDCSFDITVNDTEGPAISCPGDITTTATSDAGAVVTYATPEGTDNCTPTTSQTAGLASGATFPLGTTDNTFTVTDPAGLSASCSFSITVLGVAPDINCPVNITVNNDLGICGAAVSFAASETTGIPTSSISYSHTPGSTFSVGTTTVTATATNSNGSDNCTFDITVIDNEAPKISCPSNIPATATSAAGAVVNYTAPVGTDNCSPTTSQTAGLASGSTFPIGTTTNTFTVTDQTGASVSCSFTVNVEGLAPEIMCPDDITVDTDPGQCTAVVTYEATETAGIPASSISYSIDPGSTFALGTTPVTATATNAVGSDDCTFNVIVEDNTNPEITCPGPITSGTDPGQCGASIEFEVTATDNCEETTIVCTIGGEEEEEEPSECATNNVDLSITFDNYPEETSWMIMSMTDGVVASGGTYDDQPDGSTIDLSFDLADGEYMFVIMDSANDGICCGIFGDGSYSLSSEGEEIATGGEFDGSEKVSFCVQAPTSGGMPLTEVTSGDFFPVGTTTVTCTVTDGSGNRDVCTFDITVNDTEAPMIDNPCPGNITLCGAQNVSWTPPTATDNCSVVLTESNYDPGDFFEVGTYTVTYTFYDAAGLSVSCSFDITINSLPEVAISQEDVPQWCQGIQVLTANILNPEDLAYPLTYAWSDELGGNPIVIAPANGEYDVEVTDALGCSSEVSVVVDESISELLSAYTIISGEELEMYASDVISGGVGVEEADENEIALNTNIFTFLRADGDQVEVDGSSFINDFIDDDFEIDFPPYLSNSNLDFGTTNVPDNTTMTLSGSIYGKILVGAGATLIIDVPQIYIHSLATANGATILLTQPTEIMVRRRLSIGQSNVINPDGHTAVLYVSDNASVGQGSDVTMNIYAPEGLDVSDSGASLTTYMTGMFVSNDRIFSDHNVVWNWNLDCSFLPTGDVIDPLAQIIGEGKPETVGVDKVSETINVYPNPSAGIVNFEVGALLGQEVELFLYDSFGKQLMRKPMGILEVPTISIDLTSPGYAPGLYQICFKAGGEWQNVRFVLSK